MISKLPTSKGTGFGPSGSVPVRLLLSCRASTRTTTPASARPAQSSVVGDPARPLGSAAGTEGRQPRRTRSRQSELAQHVLHLLGLVSHISGELVAVR